MRSVTFKSECYLKSRGVGNQEKALIVACGSIGSITRTSFYTPDPVGKIYIEGDGRALIRGDRRLFVCNGRRFPLRRNKLLARVLNGNRLPWQAQVKQVEQRST